MYDAFLGLLVDVRLHAEVLLLAFLGLVHLRMALPALVIGRRELSPSVPKDARDRGFLNWGGRAALWVDATSQIGASA